MKLEEFNHDAFRECVIAAEAEIIAVERSVILRQSFCVMIQDSEMFKNVSVYLCEIQSFRRRLERIIMLVELGVDEKNVSYVSKETKEALWQIQGFKRIYIFVPEVARIMCLDDAEAFLKEAVICCDGGK